MPLLIFIYSMMGRLICKQKLLWLEVIVEFLILRWPLRTLGLLLCVYQTELFQWIGVFFFVTTFYHITVSYLLNKLFPENWVLLRWNNLLYNKVNIAKSFMAHTAYVFSEIVERTFISFHIFLLIIQFF